jgi:hypothetical protein
MTFDNVELSQILKMNGFITKLAIYYLVISAIAVSIPFSWPADLSAQNPPQIMSQEKKEERTKQLYIPKDNPRAIYMEGQPEPILRVEDLPSEIPGDIPHDPLTSLDRNGFLSCELSPNKTKMAFSAGTVRQWNGIYELTTKETEILSLLGEGDAGEAYWAPNSKYVAFQNREASGFATIYIADANLGKMICSLGDVGLDCSNPRWSEDSQKLQYSKMEIQMEKSAKTGEITNKSKDCIFDLGAFLAKPKLTKEEIEKERERHMKFKKEQRKARKEKKDRSESQDSLRTEPKK